MTKFVIMIEELGHCIRVPEINVPEYQAKGYRLWDGPVPVPGQETIHQIPGIEKLLAENKVKNARPGATRPVITGKTDPIAQVKPNGATKANGATKSNGPIASKPKTAADRPKGD